MRFEIQARTAYGFESADRGRKQQATDPLSLAPSRYGHLGQFENAVAVILEGDRADDIAGPACHKDKAAVRDDFAEWIRQHAFVDRFDGEKIARATRR